MILGCVLRDTTVRGKFPLLQTSFQLLSELTVTRRVLIRATLYLASAASISQMRFEIGRVYPFAIVRLLLTIIKGTVLIIHRTESTRRFGEDT